MFSTDLLPPPQANDVSQLRNIGEKNSSFIDRFLGFSHSPFFSSPTTNESTFDSPPNRHDTVMISFFSYNPPNQPYVLQI